MWNVPASLEDYDARWPRGESRNPLRVSSEPYSSRSPWMAMVWQRTPCRSSSRHHPEKSGASQVSIQASKTQPALDPWYRASRSNRSLRANSAWPARTPASVRSSTKLCADSVITAVQSCDSCAAVATAIAPPTLCPKGIIFVSFNASKRSGTTFVASLRMKLSDSRPG